MQTPLDKWQHLGPLNRWVITESERVRGQLEKLAPFNPEIVDEYIDGVKSQLSRDPYKGKKAGPPLGRGIWGLKTRLSHGSNLITTTVYYVFDDIGVHLLDIKVDIKPNDTNQEEHNSL